MRMVYRMSGAIDKIRPWIASDTGLRRLWRSAFKSTVLPRKTTASQLWLGFRCTVGICPVATGMVLDVGSIKIYVAASSIASSTRLSFNLLAACTRVAKPLAISTLLSFSSLYLLPAIFFFPWQMRQLTKSVCCTDMRVNRFGGLILLLMLSLVILSNSSDVAVISFLLKARQVGLIGVVLVAGAAKEASRLRRLIHSLLCQELAGIVLADRRSVTESPPTSCLKLGQLLIPLLGGK